MQVVMAFAVLVAAALPAVLATVDLFCGCKMRHHQDWTYAIHCSRQQGGSSGVSCEKTGVPDIPPGYHYVPGYALVKLHRTFEPWAVAKKICQEEGAQLAVPPDKFAYDGLKKIFPKQKGIRNAYIGITDEASEGVFVGLDGRPVSYLPWMPNEPNNGNGLGENCVYVHDDGLLNDTRCSSPEPFICERRLVVGVPDSYTWSEEAGRFYRVHKEGEGHEYAANVCRFENATLAVPDTWRRAMALLRLLEPNTDAYHIGFTDEAVEGDFVTETGRHLKDMEFQLWGVDEPNNSDQGRPENCVSLLGIGVYNDVRCDNDKRLMFICEIVPI